MDDLKGELGGKFESLIVGLMSPPLAYDVKCLRDAIKVGDQNARREDDDQTGAMSELEVSARVTLLI